MKEVPFKSASDAEIDSSKDSNLMQNYKRYPRSIKKRLTITEYPEAEGHIWGVATANEIDLDGLILSLQSPENREEIRIDHTFAEVIFCTAFAEKTVFIFRFGCIVAWNISTAEQKQLISIVHPFMKNHYKSKCEEDSLRFSYDSKTAIRGDTIYLVTENIFEKLSYSYAIAQSIKLSFFESCIEETIENTQHIPAELALTGEVRANRLEIGKKIGELFVNRFFINLQTDLLDTPDILWDHDDYSNQYDYARCYLEIAKRAKVLNQRLDIIRDLYDMLNQEIAVKHGYQLEWIVIILICVEVLIEVVWHIILKDIYHIV